MSPSRRPSRPGYCTAIAPASRPAASAPGRQHAGPVSQPVPPAESGQYRRPTAGVFGDPAGRRRRPRWAAAPAQKIAGIACRCPAWQNRCTARTAVGCRVDRAGPRTPDRLGGPRRGLGRQLRQRNLPVLRPVARTTPVVRLTCEHGPPPSMDSMNARGPRCQHFPAFTRSCNTAKPVLTMINPIFPTFAKVIANPCYLVATQCKRVSGNAVSGRHRAGSAERGQH